jgi:hypothetical protein
MIEIMKYRRLRLTVAHMGKLAVHREFRSENLKGILEVLGAVIMKICVSGNDAV